jgi:hypothetical protein
VRRGGFEPPRHNQNRWRADTTYGNGEFLQWLADRNVTAFMRTRDSALRKNNPGYGPERFTYQPASNTYRCPAGEQLNYVGLNVRNRAHACIGSAKRCGGYLQAMGSARFVATAAQLLLFATLCMAKLQGFQTTGKLVCILGPTVSTTSSAKNEKGAYGLVLQVKGDVYRCMEKRQGLLRRRRFRERDWPLGRPVQVLVDEGRGEVYMQDQRKHRNEVVLQCAERVSLESWAGCITEH